MICVIMQKNSLMTTLEIPQFSNSCGKIFADKIILATAHKESEIALSDIRKVKFASKPQSKSLFFVALPALLFVFPFFTGDDDAFLNIVFVLFGILLMSVSLYNLNKKHSVSIKLASGSSVSINVWEGNIKEAKKFAGMVNSKIARRS